MKFKIGQGIDFHELVKDKKFILGGVLISSEFGPLAHSDGDVLIHAICDSLFGAIALGDIGYHFPNTNSEYKDISSLLLLKQTVQILLNKGFLINNIDCNICLEKPKIQPFIIEMKKIITPILRIGHDELSIKATTTEKLGFIGRGEGVMATATSLIVNNL